MMNQLFFSVVEGDSILWVYWFYIVSEELNMIQNRFALLCYAPMQGLSTLWILYALESKEIPELDYAQRKNIQIFYRTFRFDKLLASSRVNHRFQYSRELHTILIWMRKITSSADAFIKLIIYCTRTSTTIFTIIDCNCIVNCKYGF